MTDAQLRQAIDELEAGARLTAVDRYERVAAICRAIEARGRTFDHRGVRYEAEVGGLRRRDPRTGR